MANALSPTAANILSSLGIKGATVSAPLPGYVPVLGADGKLSAAFIPADAAQAALPHLSDAAFVDPNTSVAYDLRNGSVVAPYKTLGEAAARFRPSDASQSLKTVAFILAPGIYDDDGNTTVSFPANWTPRSLYVVGLGGCRFYRDVVVSGMDASASEQAVVIQDVNFGAKNVTILGSASVTLLGRTYVGGTLSAGSVEEGGVRVPTNVASIRLSPDAYVGSPYADRIDYLADAARVGNTSGVPGATVKDALDRLDARKIRVARIAGSGSGLLAGSSYDVAAESSGGVDVYRLADGDRALVAAIRDLYGKFTDIDARTVTAVDVTATGTLTAKTLSIDVLRLGPVALAIDTYGYLVVSEGSGGSHDPEGQLVLTDVGDGSLWLIGVDAGRLFVERYEGGAGSGSDSSSDSYSDGSSPAYPTSIDLFDLGEEYKVEIRNGRMFITKAGEA